MIRMLALTASALTLLTACSQAPQTAEPVVQAEPVQAPDPALAGRWGGVLEAGSQTLRLELDVDLSGAEPTIVLTSVNQGGASFPMRQVQLDGSNMSFATPGMALSYQGVLENGVITGTFNQGGLSAPLEFEPLQADMETQVEPPVPTLLPNEQAFTVSGPDGDLVGVLTTPETLRAGVVILSGSGPQDRNGLMFDQPVYAALAQLLAGQGIASLRLDDRGVGETTMPAPQSPDDLADDASRALVALQSATGQTCSGFVGHSEGGMIALKAVETSQPEFIISLAGMHLDMQTTLYAQSEAMHRASGLGDEAIVANRVLQTAVFEAIEIAAPGQAPAAIEVALIEAGAPETLAQQQAAIWGQPYAVAMFREDPTALAAAYPGPMLVFFGENDTQVLADLNTQALQRAREGLSTEIHVVTGVDHLFQDNETGAPAHYGAAGHPLSPTAIATFESQIGEFIDEACSG